MFGDMIEYIPALEPYGLETSILGLEFQVETFHLKNGALRIKCTATIGNGYWVSNITLHEASLNVQAQPSSPLSSGTFYFFISFTFNPKAILAS